MALAGGRLPLGRQRIDARRRRHAVERHVDNRGDPAGRGGARGRVEPLPLGAPRLVDVHMGVDNSRRDDEGTGVKNIGACG